MADDQHDAPPLRPQKRGRKIAMTDAERDDFLAGERTCRVATLGLDGPHATPLWFAWDGSCLWLYSIQRSQRWADLECDPRISAVVDAGTEYFELRGVEITGRAEPVGELPRTGAPDAALVEVERIFGGKYLAENNGEMFHDLRHGWLRITPTKITSWDFRKLGK
ncbi:pyridoxamine 5'-phosphate oxidase family protein [uncultured Jatrophihabitans sp.]|uniref:pyridoxamine 5'-phosphate oxidase family protein n=1 Tax=uncultured Jatrophihabitans sp. TaxID=1610747 RepID=UPI0035CAEA55